MPPSAEKVRQHNLKVGKQSRSGEMKSCRYCLEGSDDEDSTKPITVDTLKQLLKHEITEASRRLLGNCQRNCRTVPSNFKFNLSGVLMWCFCVCADLCRGKSWAPSCRAMQKWTTDPVFRRHGRRALCFVGMGA